MFERWSRLKLRVAFDASPQYGVCLQKTDDRRQKSENSWLISNPIRFIVPSVPCCLSSDL